MEGRIIEVLLYSVKIHTVHVMQYGYQSIHVFKHTVVYNYAVNNLSRYDLCNSACYCRLAHILLVTMT